MMHYYTLLIRLCSLTLIFVRVKSSFWSAFSIGNLRPRFNKQFIRQNNHYNDTENSQATEKLQEQEESTKHARETLNKLLKIFKPLQHDRNISNFYDSAGKANEEYKKAKNVNTKKKMRRPPYDTKVQEKSLKYEEEEEKTTPKSKSNDEYSVKESQAVALEKFPPIHHEINTPKSCNRKEKLIRHRKDHDKMKRVKYQQHGMQEMKTHKSNIYNRNGENMKRRRSKKQFVPLNHYLKPQTSKPIIEYTTLTPVDKKYIQRTPPSYTGLKSILQESYGDSHFGHNYEYGEGSLGMINSRKAHKNRKNNKNHKLNVTNKTYLTGEGNKQEFDLPKIIYTDCSSITGKRSNCREDLTVNGELIVKGLDQKRRKGTLVKEAILKHPTKEKMETSLEKIFPLKSVIRRYTINKVRK